MMKPASNVQLNKEAYLMDLRDKVANQVMETLTAMELPDDLYHQHILTTSLLGVASLLACGTADYDEKQFLAKAKEMFATARFMLGQETRTHIPTQ